MTRISRIGELEALREEVQSYRKSFQSTIILCGGTGCQASRSKDLIQAVKDGLITRGLEKNVLVRATGCHGFCEQGPIAVIEPGNTFYCHVAPEDVQEIIEKTIVRGELVERLLYTDPVSGDTILTESDIPFYRAQDRQLLAQNREVDPCSIQDYIAIGG